VNVRGEVHAYLPPEHYRRLKLEAAARRVSLSQCVGDCLGEYFALREEMATALETPDQAEELSRRVIHVLLAETEQRLVATFERYVEDLAAVRGGVDALLAMLDRAAFLALCQTPETPPEAQDRALASAQRRFAQWRQAVASMLHISGRPVPWPLAHPEAGELRGPERAASAAGDEPGTARQPRRTGPDGRLTEPGDPRPPSSAARLDRPAQEGPPSALDRSDRPPDRAPVGGAGLRARLARHGPPTQRTTALGGAVRGRQPVASLRRNDLPRKGVGRDAAYTFILPCRSPGTVRVEDDDRPPPPPCGTTGGCDTTLSSVKGRVPGRESGGLVRGRFRAKVASPAFC
jgi:hypothetical protein